jgi:hypothetical protein
LQLALADDQDEAKLLNRSEKTKKGRAKSRGPYRKSSPTKIRKRPIKVNPKAKLSVGK